MSATIYDVLDELRAKATSERHKGELLERLIAQFLRTDPTYADQFNSVWMWDDWPGRDGSDAGIDLVAEDSLTGGLVAVQVKFYQEDRRVSRDDIDRFLARSGKVGFTDRIIVTTTTGDWGPHAEAALHGQQIPVRRIGLPDLAASVVDWDAFTWDRPDILPVSDKKTLRPHQAEAIQAVTAGLSDGDRGKLIMACGTGKTFTALRLAEQLVGSGGRVLFLVPSISLLSQTLREWATAAVVDLAPIAVCSDRKATKRSSQDEDISTVDLALPSTTDPAVVADRLAAAASLPEAMTVVFSTYQSIDVIARAQAAGADPFDLIICDEAHRTTGTTLAGDEESAFVRVHDNTYLAGAKRLYMTATPRIYDDTSKAKAGEANAVVASMDDEDVFGPELHRLGFGEAVDKGLLVDYKVLVLAVDETSVSRTFQLQLADDGNELRLDDAAKIVGCWNGLAKRGGVEHSFGADPAPMRRAVAFSGTIRASKQIEALFGSTIAQYSAAHDLDKPAGDPSLRCEIQHVDGSFNALERNTRLDWLRADVPDGTCRILTNARCLSEGVDVPTLDAVMFLSPRKSQVDIVQSVGRVMRKPPEGQGDKQYGYIILPIGIPAGMSPEEALKDNKRYAVVWEVLQALRAHDERFNAMINRIELTKARDDKVNVVGVPGGADREAGDDGTATQGLLDLAFLDEWREAIYARIVAKVGSRNYWPQWARDIADIANRHVTRITALLDGGSPAVTEEFGRFLAGLRGILNDGITRTDAIEMLAQHLITRPVFEALFAEYDFAAHNPVSQTMDRMLAVLDEHRLDDENDSLEKFYDSVRMRANGVDTAEGRQKLIVQLYDKFFATAFKKTVKRLGIVYTPVEIVDFILRSADDVLRQHFGQGLSDDGVHILDGFTGTGTFIVRLLQLGLIKPHDLARKYTNELHANEILLLAYYIAAINIETTYQDAIRGHVGQADYEPFQGLVLTDTFQSYEDGDKDAFDAFPATSQRITRQRELPITVIIGNPPYSSGQDSANDAAANQSYPHLDASIAATYTARSRSGSRFKQYDAYIRAIRWASLRIGERGVVAYVTNGGWLDSNTADGMRKVLAEEFSDIHIYNLRGNQRTAGEPSRREGGKVFEAGSRATIAITLLVKTPNHTGPATIHYTDIGDYLTREDKLARIATAGTVARLEPVTHITPNEHGDWLNQRSDDFSNYLKLGGEEGVFSDFSMGVVTNRDAWVYGSRSNDILEAVSRATRTYTDSLVRGERNLDSSKIKWSASLDSAFKRRRQAPAASRGDIRVATYRPFFRQHLFFKPFWNQQVSQVLRDAFPTADHDNVGFVVMAPRVEARPSVLMVDTLPDLSFYTYTGQFFARWRYERVEEEGMLTLDDGEGEVVDGYRKIDNITDHALRTFRDAYGQQVTKDDIFFYCYGLLHSPDYRETYAADLKKSLPRIPLVDDPAPYIAAGRELSKLHLGYETGPPYPLDGLDLEAPSGTDPFDFYRVEKMKFAKVRDSETGKLVADRSAIIYNSKLTLSGIPEGAYRYQLGSRSAVEWIIDRYQVKTDKASGIVNDPNDWSREVGDPRYIVDLLARIVTVSLETVRIVESLPTLQVRG